MSMTRDSYAKEVIKAAEAAFLRNEAPECPHEDCTEHLSVVRQSVFSTRSLFCPVHGHIFQEQAFEAFSKLDWEGAESRCSGHADDDEESDDLDDAEGYED